MTIQFKNVFKRYDKKIIFDDLSFQIRAGARILFLGPSGTGKTTLFQLILGFDTVDSGEILIDGEPVNPLLINDLRKKVAYIPQIVELGQGIVKDILDELMSFQANTRLTHWQEKLTALLPKFNLEAHILEQQFSMLSGGEKQRLAIIIAILLEREIFLLDEPTAALDTALKQKITHYFSERTDATLLIISHDVEWRQLDGIKTINLTQ